MAISQVGTGTKAGFADQTSVTGTEPSGVQADDILIGFSVFGDHTELLTPPSGWLPIETFDTSAVDGGIWYIVRGGSAPGLQWTWNGAASRYVELIIVAFRGVDTTSPIDVEGTPVSDTGSTNPDPPSITPVTNNVMVLVFTLHWTGAPSGGYTAPTNYTLMHSSSIDEDIGIAGRLLTGGAGTPEDPSAFGGNPGVSNIRWAHTIALKESGGGGGGAGSEKSGVNINPFSSQSITKQIAQGTYFNKRHQLNPLPIFSKARLKQIDVNMRLRYVA